MKNKRATTLHKNYLYNCAKYSNMVRNYLHCLSCGKISSLVYPNQLLRTVYTFIYLRQQNRSKLEIFKYVNGQTTIPKRNASWKCLEKGNVWFRPLWFFLTGMVSKTNIRSYCEQIYTGLFVVRQNIVTFLKSDVKVVIHLQLDVRRG